MPASALAFAAYVGELPFLENVPLVLPAMGCRDRRGSNLSSRRVTEKADARQSILARQVRVGQELGVNKLPSVGLQSRQGGAVVAAHEQGIAHHIGRYDSRKSSVVPCQASLPEGLASLNDREVMPPNSNGNGYCMSAMRKTAIGPLLACGPNRRPRSSTLSRHKRRSNAVIQIQLDDQHRHGSDSVLPSDHSFVHVQQQRLRDQALSHANAGAVLLDNKSKHRLVCNADRELEC